jgi:hypothetical protein
LSRRENLEDEMAIIDVVKKSGRSVALAAGLLGAVSLGVAPMTAEAAHWHHGHRGWHHGGGGGVALGIIGGALAGAAIAGAANSYYNPYYGYGYGYGYAPSYYYYAPRYYAPYYYGY